MAVENVVRHFLSITMEDSTVIHAGLGHAVGWSMGALYADDDHWVAGSGMASGGPQLTDWPILSDWPDGQHHQV